MSERLIVCTNDDGILAPGLVALALAARELGRVIVVAPEGERSACSHSLTMNRPLAIQPLDHMPGGDAIRWYAVDGTPADCVHIACQMPIERVPDLVLSGINPGPNLGDDAIYSGTVAAAREALIQGTRGLAVSLGGPPFAFGRTARRAVAVARRLLDLPPGDVFHNLNLPATEGDAPIPLVWARPGRRDYRGGMVETVNPRGRRLYWIAGMAPLAPGEPGTDVDAAFRGHASLTAFGLDASRPGAGPDPHLPDRMGGRLE